MTGTRELQGLDAGSLVEALDLVWEALKTNGVADLPFFDEIDPLVVARFAYRRWLGQRARGIKDPTAEDSVELDLAIADLQMCLAPTEQP